MSLLRDDDDDVTIKRQKKRKMYSLYEITAETAIWHQMSTEFQASRFITAATNTSFHM
jgi:hypothetical protein